MFQVMDVIGSETESEAEMEDCDSTEVDVLTTHGLRNEGVLAVCHRSGRDAHPKCQPIS